MMRKKLALLACAALLSGACGGDLLDPAAATVNGDKITIDEMEQSLAEYESSDAFEQASQQGDPATLKEAYEQQELTRRIFRGVLEPEAEERGVEVTDEAVQEEMETVRQDFASDSAYEEALKEQGLSEELLESLVYDQLLERAVKNDVTADLTPSDEELRSFYEDNAQRYIETDVSHIVLGSKSAAKGVLKDLREVSPEELEQRFAQVARSESVYDATAAAGGDLGYLISGEGDPAFEQAASRTPTGSVSAPVNTELGWELILVKDRRPIPFEDVRGDIVDALAGEERDKAWEEWLVEAYEEAEIEVNPRYGVLDPETREVVDPEVTDLPGSEDAPTEAPEDEPAQTPAG